MIIHLIYQNTKALVLKSQFYSRITDTSHPPHKFEFVQFLYKFFFLFFFLYLNDKPLYKKACKLDI